MRSQGKGYSASEILREFFKIEPRSAELAERIVRPILCCDQRFVRTKDLTWNAVKKVELEQLPLAEVPFMLLYIGDIRQVNEKGFDREQGFVSALSNYASFLLYRGGAAEPVDSVKGVLKESNRYVFVPYDARSLSWLKKIYRTVSPLLPDLNALSMRTLTAILFPEKTLKTWEDIVKAFSIVHVQSELPASKVQTLLQIFEFLMRASEERGLKTLDQLQALMSAAEKAVDFSRYGFRREDLREVPALPGVYFFFDKNGCIIYVGKTGNLKERLRSYFRKTGESEDKIRGLLESLHAFKYRVCGSALEALIEEHRLIDEHKPRFNTKVSIPERPLEVSDKILLLPSSADGYIKLYFLSNGAPLIEIDLDCANIQETLLLETLRRLEAAAGYVFDPLKVIAVSYLKGYEEQVNAIDLDRYGSPEGVVKVLRAFCADANALLREKTVYLEG